MQSASTFALPSAKKQRTRAQGPSRNYNESFLKFGFIATGSDDKPPPQCVTCCEVLANASMKTSKLLRRQQKKH
jgi:hypothetical protein